MKSFCFVFLCAFALAVLPAAAQTPVVNPTTVEFTASADHASLTSYELRIVVVSAPTVIVSKQNLGKPTPVANLISLALNPTPALPQSSTVQYLAFVAAISPAGEGVSAASNPFIVAAPPAAPGTPVVKK